MNTELTVKESKVPKIQDLYNNIELYEKHDELAFILNQQPPEKWVARHPYIKNYNYLPIDKVEYLLRQIFKDYKIEITGQGTAFNGVWVTVRVHYKDIVTGDMKFHDGIGASELQTKKGESVANLNAINPGAISMAFPIAKTVAIKDACDHFGRLFGSDLNRKDLVAIRQPKKSEQKDPDTERMEILVKNATTLEDIEFARVHVTDKVLLAELDLKEVKLKKQKK